LAKTARIDRGAGFYAGVVFGCGGRTLYSGHVNAGYIAVLDARTGAERAEIKVELDPADQIRGIDLHPGGKRFLLTTGSLRHNISILDGSAQPETGWRSGFRHWQIPQAPPPEASNETA
jgi:hypothetical protein